MSWIKENKFVAGLAGATAVIGGAIFFFGNSQGSAYDAKMQEFDELRAQHNKLAKAKPYPNAANLKTREVKVKQYEDVISDVRQALIGYRPGELKQLTPEQFGDIQVKMQADLRKAFSDAGTTLPQGCGFGFEKYAEGLPKSAATARLSFQLGAMQWVLQKLAEAKPDAILTIRREDLDVEKGEVASTPPQRGDRGAAKKVEKPYVLMPVEMAFTITEDALRNFLKEMANSKEHYYAIRAIRIRNDKQTAPTVNDADFPEAGGFDPGAVDPGLGGFNLPGDEGEEEEDAPAPEPAAANGEQILKQVLGNEKLNVYISFDILLIKGKKPADSEPVEGSDAAAPDNG